MEETKHSKFDEYEIIKDNGVWGVQHTRTEVVIVKQMYQSERDARDHFDHLKDSIGIDADSNN